MPYENGENAKGHTIFIACLRKNEPASELSGQKATTMTKRERKDSRVLSFILSVFMCFSPLFTKNDDDEWVYDKCTQKYIFSLSLFRPTVVAQSYKIDVEILAAPRGTYNSKYMKINIIYEQIEYKFFSPFTLSVVTIRLYRNTSLCHTDIRKGARSCCFMGSRACIFHLSLTSRRYTVHQYLVLFPRCGRMISKFNLLTFLTV